jgi:DNA helicase HerA-like ATPase
MTQCIMRIVNPIDQNAVASAVESVGRDLLAELPGLSKGQVIVSGAALNTPVLCQVRERLTRHGGEDKDAPAEWLAYFQDRNRERRREQQAFLPSDGGFSIFRSVDS